MASDNSEESKIAEEVKGPEENDDVIALRARNIPRATGPAQHLEFTPVPAPPPTQEAPRDGPGQRGPPSPGNRHARQRASVMTGHVKRLNLPLLARGATLVKLRRVKLRRPREWMLSNPQRRGRHD